VLTSVSRAKYIEGLENRLGRMESLLRMSGLLSEEEAGKTDLGTLEKRLAEKASSKEFSAQKSTETTTAPSKSSSASVAAENSPRPTSARDSLETPRDNLTSPSTDGDKPSREEVENLSEAMCSLVTNNVGETRYIGTHPRIFFSRHGELTRAKALLLPSPSSQAKA
jgi:hypothetical protein